MERLKGEGVQDWLVQHLTSPWHGHQTVASELGNDILVNIKERWSQLESSVRLGVLFSLICLKKAQQIQLREKCQELIDSACTDTDDWVKLISQMLKDYPKEASLRFNVEQFSGQEQLGSLMKVLQDNIVQNGIKFHPKEYAYLNESVCKAGQGKDPNTGTYPPPSGPSLQQHFSLRDSNSSIHTSRAERLKKMAEQASPILPLSANTTPPMGTTGTLPGQSGTGVASVAAGAAGITAPGAPPAPIPGGPPRPVRSASSGLFVSRKPAGSFLRNNAPRPMPLPRNPSTGQLPLRSPRLDQPLTPRLNQKSSRIQILDIQQGNEIMQSMNDAKLRLEQAEQREKELKKEQRQQEMELKRQQDAEKKAQVLREKEEKKREREEAKKAKERQRQEREELQQERGRERSERDQHRETRSPPEDDEDEGSLSSQPAKKRSRISSSRRGSRDDGEDSGNDKDRSESGTEPKSPITPSLTKSYSRHMIHDDEPPQTQTISMESAYTTVSSSSRNAGETHQGQQQQFQLPLQQQTPGLGSLDPGLDGTVEHPTLFQNTNLLTKEDRAYITAFLQGHPVIRPNDQDIVYQIVMNQEQVQDATGKMMYELILIEMNFDTGEWRKIKRKRNKPHVEVSQLQQQ